MILSLFLVMVKEWGRIGKSTGTPVACGSWVYINGLQVNGGMFDREFTKSLIIRDFDDVLKNPFMYVDLFLLHI